MLALIAAALLAAVTSAVVVAIAVASRRHKQGARGDLKLIGRVGTVERDLSPDGTVMIAGEVWPARTRSGRSLSRAHGPRVRVVGVAGHWLEVEPEE